MIQVSYFQPVMFLMWFIALKYFIIYSKVVTNVVNFIWNNPNFVFNLDTISQHFNTPLVKTCKFNYVKLMLNQFW